MNSYLLWRMQRPKLQPSNDSVSLSFFKTYQHSWVIKRPPTQSARAEEYTDCISAEGEDWNLSDSKTPQIPMTILNILADFISAVVRIILILPWFPAYLVFSPGSWLLSLLYLWQGLSISHVIVFWLGLSELFGFQSPRMFFAFYFLKQILVC